MQKMSLYDFYPPLMSRVWLWRPWKPFRIKQTIYRTAEAPSSTTAHIFFELIKTSNNVNIDVSWLKQKYLDQIIQAIFQVQAFKKGSSFLRDKLIAKLLNIYSCQTLMKYYNYCQQRKYYFVTAEAIGLNQIMFTAFFL